MTLARATRHEEWFTLAAAFRELERYGDAVTAYRHALGFRPEDAESWHRIGNCLVAIGQDDDAMAAYRRALALDPGHAGARLNLGTILGARGSAEAVSHLRLRRRIDPDAALLLEGNLRGRGHA